MTTQSDFVKYNRLKRRLEKELNTTENEIQYKKTWDLYRRNFPTKEQVIAEVQAFFDAEEAEA